jgi:hypothetical protein
MMLARGKWTIVQFRHLHAHGIVYHETHDSIARQSKAHYGSIGEGIGCHAEELREAALGCIK